MSTIIGTIFHLATAARFEIPRRVKTNFDRGSENRMDRPTTEEMTGSNESGTKLPPHMQHPEFCAGLNCLGRIAGDRGGQGFKKPLEMHDRKVLSTTVALRQTGNGLVHVIPPLSSSTGEFAGRSVWDDVQMWPV